MAYRLTGTDPFLRAAIGAFNGYQLRNGVGGGISLAALLKRRATGAWHGIHVIDDGGTTNHFYNTEFNPSNQIIGANSGANWPSTATFTDTANFGIYGFTWNGGTASGDWTWRWKVGAGAWSNEAETAAQDTAVPTAVGSGFRHLIGNEAGLGDDADYDIVCIGAIKGALSQASFESLDMLSFATWQAIFAGLGAWLLGFDTIATQLDRTGNGGDELSRSAGITLVSDPPGWLWGGVPAVRLPRPLMMKLGRPGKLALRVPIVGRPVWPGPVVASTPVSGSAVDPLEALQGINAGLAVPLDAAAGVASTGAADPVEAVQGIAASLADPVEAGQGVASSALDPLDAAAGVSSASPDPLDATGAVASTAGDPLEATQNLAAAAADPLETGQGVAVVAVVPLEALSGLASALSDPLEASGNTPVSQTSSAVLEALSAVQATLTDPVEAGQGVTQATVAVVEAGRGVAATSLDPLEAAAAVAAALQVPFETVRVVTVAVQVPLETLRGVAAAASDPLDVDAAVFVAALRSAVATVQGGGSRAEIRVVVADASGLSVVEPASAATATVSG